MNPFEQVCAMAIQEKWCLVHRCSCMNSHFRYALKELTLGRLPGDSDWFRGVEVGLNWRRDRSVARGLANSTALLSLCRLADVTKISDNCLVAFIEAVYEEHVRRDRRIAERTRKSAVLPARRPESIELYKKLSVDWAQQLLQKYGETSPLSSRLLSIINDDDRVLSLSDLIVEADMSKSALHSDSQVSLFEEGQNE